jgi:hypothetical protein
MYGPVAGGSETPVACQRHFDSKSVSSHKLARVEENRYRHEPSQLRDEARCGIVLDAFLDVRKAARTGAGVRSAVNSQAFLPRSLQGPAGHMR